MKLTRSLLLITCALCTLGIGVAVALGEEVSKDEWKPAGKQFKAESNNSGFLAAGNEAKCQTFALDGHLPAGNGTTFTEAEAQAETAVNPHVSNCNFATTVNGPWHIQLHSNGKGFEGQCTVDGDSSDDCITLHLPANAAKVNFVICEVIVGAQALVIPYEDEEFEAGKHNTSFEVKELVVKTGGTCGVTSAKFKGTFKVVAEAQGALITDE